MFGAMDDLGAKILQAIAVYLKLGDGFFEDKVEMGNSDPADAALSARAEDAPGVRAGAHEDINTITLLLGAEEAGCSSRTPTASG
jgi:isopenicillin N synthase-like dioxygenase